MNDIEENIRTVRTRLADAAAACGRRIEDITLIAVSKTVSVGSISSAVSAGHFHFGENRVQEAEFKIPHLRSKPNIHWHMIGHLQSNKAHRAAELFDVVHSVDSVRLARKLSQACLSIGMTRSVLIQVDLGNEETKFGAGRGEVPDIVDAILGYEGLHLDGLMTIPPYFEEQERTRPYFAALRELAQSLERHQPGCLGARHLSMGMSHDFEIAIQEGATMVRIGTAIFGERIYG